MKSKCQINHILLALILIEIMTFVIFLFYDFIRILITRYFFFFSIVSKSILLYFSGVFPNQNPHVDGLTKWTLRDESLVDADLVVWHVFGVTHVSILACEIGVISK